MPGHTFGWVKGWLENIEEILKIDPRLKPQSAFLRPFLAIFTHFSRFSSLTRSFLNVWSSNLVSGRILGCVNRCSENIEEIFKIALPAGKKRPKNDCFSVIWRPLLPVLIIVVPVCIINTLNVIWILFGPPSPARGRFCTARGHKRPQNDCFTAILRPFLPVCDKNTLDVD